MSRAHLVYGERHQPTRMFEGHDPDSPAAGYYRMRLRSGGIYVGVRIWFGPPLDPIDGTVLDRSYRWQATANGQEIPMERVWSKCADDVIDKTEHDYLAATQAWAQQHAPDSPQANPKLRINPLTAPTPF